MVLGVAGSCGSTRAREAFLEVPFWREISRAARGDTEPASNAVPAVFPGRHPGGMIFDMFGNHDLAWRFGVSMGIVAGIVQILLRVPNRSATWPDTSGMTPGHGIRSAGHR
jgi:hypothetical protein